jgi:hypothetical protein|eukprot:127485_1
MNLVINIILFMSLLITIDGNARPDNFLLTFDKDLRVFGVRNGGARSRGISIPIKEDKKTEEVKVVTNINDFDRAEQSIFDTVENVEKAVLNTAGNLLRDEVDILFGKNHGSSSLLRSLQDEVPISKKNDSTKSNKRTKEMKNVTMKKSKRKIECKVEPDQEVENHSFKILQEISDCMFE